jgi:hypothetical protein
MAALTTLGAFLDGGPERPVGDPGATRADAVDTALLADNARRRSQPSPRHIASSAAPAQRSATSVKAGQRARAAG